MTFDREAHRRYVKQQLRVTYQRIHEAMDLITSGATDEDEEQWLATCAERERFANAAGSWIVDRLGLSPTESRVLWVLVAQELSPTARTHLRELATENDVDVTIDVLRRVVYGSDPSDEMSRELKPSGALRRCCLLEPVGAADVPSHRVSLRLSPRVLALAHGDIAIDDELTGLLAQRELPRHGLDGLALHERDIAETRHSMGRAEGFTIVTGLGGSGRRSLLLALAAEREQEVLAIDARRLSKDPSVADRQARVIARESTLLGRVPLFLNLEALDSSGDVPDRIDLFEAAIAGPVLATASQRVARQWRHPAKLIELEPLLGTQRADLWRQALPELSAGDGELLATLYPLAPALITSVGDVATAEAAGAPLEPAHVATGIKTVLDDRMAGLAKRLTITQAWDDLVLPEDQTMAVVELRARIRARRRVYEDWGFAQKLGKGLGVTALFSGPPGTGKTMCAGLIAKDLGTELYQVDLARIVSKWVGETEKNLAKLFDAAEAGHAVLLFDEADSLFGKRTAVTSANDRYANQETNFLLQRIESFAGICILTTNHDPAIDDAFRRRLAVNIKFPLPDEEERVKLWAAMIPESTPCDDLLDFASLAKKFVMGGGNIRNAVLRAAFLAADANERVGNYHLRQAAALEYEAMGRLGTL